MPGVHTTPVSFKLLNLIVLEMLLAPLQFENVLEWTASKGGIWKLNRQSGQRSCHFKMITP